MSAQQQSFAPVRQNTKIAAQTPNFTRVSVVDGFGLWLPGAQVSAARIGLAASPQAAARDRIADHLFRINVRRFGKFVFGTDTPANDRFGVIVSSVNEDVAFPSALYGSFHRAGWTRQIVHERQQGRGEKKVDTSLALELVEATVLRGLDPAQTEVTLVACDRDHAPVIEMLDRYGFAVDVLGWRHATSPDMIKAATGRFIALDDYYEQLTFRKTAH